MSSETATCPRCGTSKALRAFDKDSSRVNGRYPWCKLCRSKHNPKSQQSIDDPLNGQDCPLCQTPVRGHPNRRFCSAYCKNRVMSLRKKYGISVEQYRVMLDANGGLCPICSCRPKKWAVDHNHASGAVTGLVCTGCNVGLLAYSKHDVRIAESLASFLAAPPAFRSGVYVIVPEDPTGTLRGASQIHRMWGR